MDKHFLFNSINYLSTSNPRGPPALVEGCSSNEFLLFNSLFKTFNSIISSLMCSHTMFASSIAPSNRSFRIWRRIYRLIKNVNVVVYVTIKTTLFWKKIFLFLPSILSDLCSKSDSKILTWKFGMILNFCRFRELQIQSSAIVSLSDIFELFFLALDQW